MSTLFITRFNWGFGFSEWFVPSTMLIVFEIFWGTHGSWLSPLPSSNKSCSNGTRLPIRYHEIGEKKRVKIRKIQKTWDSSHILVCAVVTHLLLCCRDFHLLPWAITKDAKSRGLSVCVSLSLSFLSRTLSLSVCVCMYVHSMWTPACRTSHSKIMVINMDLPLFWEGFPLDVGTLLLRLASIQAQEQ